MFIYQQKINFNLQVFLGYCKDIANLLFSVLWACLATQNQSDTINLKTIFVFIWRQKTQVHSPRFSGDIAKLCKLLILGTLGISGYVLAMPGYAHPKSQYKLVENFEVYFHTKNTLNNPLLSWDKSCNLIGQQNLDA